jgi:hypothetical protein|tara:strand:+ start:338 stop:628 length:291 start_codon:yes stop_codon:yes gene_type:complete
MSRRSTKAKAMCDSCSFVYDMRVMKLNSYDMLVCPECFEGNYDLKNHPQNKAADVRDDTIVPNARPDIGGRNIIWEAANITWNDIPEPDTRKWGTV